MIKHITFADRNMSISGLKCKQSALRYGCDKSTVFNPLHIDIEFYEKNVQILDSERGAGYWLWKPYFIYNELQRLREDDILIYTDAGILFLQPIEILLYEFDGRLMLFGNRWIHGNWCKRDVLHGMGCEQSANKEQLQASCVIATKNSFTLKFCKEWLEWCQKPGFIDDSESTIPNENGYREHRHDQSILTNLCYTYNVPVNWWPVQYNVRHRHKYENQYPVMFLHHRYRNPQWHGDKLGLKKWIK